MPDNLTAKEPSPKGMFIFMGIVIALIIIVAASVGGKHDSTMPLDDTGSVATRSTPEQKKQPPAPINISGNGDQATQKIHLHAGLATFKSTYKGEDGNFIVDLLDVDGAEVGLAANEVGSTINSSQALQIPADGQYLFNVTSQGEWTVIITQD